MSEYKEMVVDIQRLGLEGKGFGLTESLLQYLYCELGYIPSEAWVSLSIKYKPEDITGKKNNEK